MFGRRRVVRVRFPLAPGARACRYLSRSEYRYRVKGPVSVGDTVEVPPNSFVPDRPGYALVTGFGRKGYRGPLAEVAEVWRRGPGELRRCRSCGRYHFGPLARGGCLVDDQ